MPTVPLHFLDRMIIPIHVGNNRWFPTHLDIKERQTTFLDSLHSCSSKYHAWHERFIWKLYRMASERHVAKKFPPSNWYLSPVDFARQDNWLPENHTGNGASFEKISKSYSTSCHWSGRHLYHQKMQAPGHLPVTKRFFHRPTTTKLDGTKPT